MNQRIQTFVRIFQIAAVSLVASASFAAPTPATHEMTISPGEMRIVKIAEPQADAELFCRGEKVASQKVGEIYVGFISESYYSKLEPFKCALKLHEQVVSEVAFTVQKKEYRKEALKVSARQTELSKHDQARVDNEREMIQAIYAKPLDRLQFSEPFAKPLKSKVTSVYGTSRVFNGVMASQHLGTDFRAGVGTPIPAANAGKIVFVGNLFRSGNLVIIDHGLGVFTTYHHLSKIIATKGALVKRGQIVGLAGNTGRVSGPHLHWGVNIHGELVDGLNLISEIEQGFAKADFEKILAPTTPSAI